MDKDTGQRRASLRLAMPFAARGALGRRRDHCGRAGFDLGALSCVRSRRQPEPVTKLAEGEVTHRWPLMIDRGQAVLFTASASNGQYEDANLVWWSGFQMDRARW